MSSPPALALAVLYIGTTQQQSTHALQVLWRVDARRRSAHLADRHSHAGLQRAHLLEPLERLRASASKTT